MTAITAAADPPEEKRHAVVDPQGTVINVIVWDGVEPYSPGNGRAAVPFDPAAHKFEVSNPPTPTPTSTPLVPLTTEERLAAVEADLATIKAQLGIK